MEQSVISESEPAIDNFSGRQPPERSPRTQPDKSVRQSEFASVSLSESPMEGSGVTDHRDDSNARSIMDIDVSIDENEDPRKLLEKLKGKNRDRPIVAHININFLNQKFES